MSSITEKTGKVPLECTPYIVQEIVGAIYRLFQPFTENVTIRFDEHYIQVLVFFDPDAPLILPEDGPMDIRLNRGGKQEWINTRVRHT